MIIGHTLQSLLDAPTKAFEVTLRSFVADTLLTAFPTEDALKQAIELRIGKIKDSGTILSGKMASINLLSNKEWATFWVNTQFSQTCFINSEHVYSHDVTYLSQTILLTYIFHDLHKDLINSFESPEKYLYYAHAFHDIRNALSHQGSTLINDASAQDSIKFITISCQCIDKKYFWYLSSPALLAEIDAFETALHTMKPEIENFDEVPFPSNAIVCREPEIAALFRYTCGWDGIKKSRNRKHLICVTGYGGIGKTSLVTEFLSRLLDKMQDEQYLGLRPKFILFYSAKTQSLEYDNYTGKVYIKERRKHFASFDELLSKLFHALSIEAFTDEWNEPGIVVIDNLETLPEDERRKIIEYVEVEFPSSIQTIVTTRIPEHADATVSLHGFHNEAGIVFIGEYLEKNHISLDLTNSQKSDLIRFSYGNSLVLVLAIERMSSKKTTFREIIEELKVLPQNTTEYSISSFMFQNTIDQLYTLFPESKSLIGNILILFSVASAPLSVEILGKVNPENTIDEIIEVLQLLTQYLIIDKTGEEYSINEFAENFILISSTLSQTSKSKKESQLKRAIYEIAEQKTTVEDYKTRYPLLSDILEEWSGQDDNENLAICHAFTLYDRKTIITPGNAAYEIDCLNREFSEIETNYSAHPYVYYQHARILSELRKDSIISSEYDADILKQFERCFMLLDSAPFSRIKETKTYPSILWIYSLFLLSINAFEAASSFSENAMTHFTSLKIFDYRYYDAKLVFGIAEINLFLNDSDLDHLKNALSVRKTINIQKDTQSIIVKHYDELNGLLKPYNYFSA